jgi:hypothetical protein
MKTITTYNLGPGWAMLKVELRTFDGEDVEDLRKVAMEVSAPIQSNDVPMGIFYPGKYLKNHKEPLLILLNERRSKRWLTHVLPHELCHLIGFLCKRYNAEPGSENAAYTMGYLMEEFSAVLTEHMKTIPVDPEPNKVELNGETVEFATRD